MLWPSLAFPLQRRNRIQEDDHDDVVRPDSEDQPREADREFGSLEAQNDASTPTGYDDVDEDEEDDAEEDEGNSRNPTRTSTSISWGTSITTFNGPPKWYLRLRDFLKPEPHDLNDYIPNYRYTPILSGVVIPFAILLEIPGLTGRWYIRTSENDIVETQDNPAILDIGMAFSMASALAANLCLISRFLEKRVKSMTIACIFFLTTHDIINILSVIIFGVEHRFDDGFTYGQSFWMVVCSTVASTFTNVTLIIDFFRTPDFAKSGSGLTRKQRSLVIVVILLLCYVALGALVHTYLLQLAFINALYFTVVTIETVGLGDITPETTGGRVFVCVYAAFGVINLALAVGLIRETVLEALEVGYRKRVQAVRDKRRELHQQRRIQRRWREAIEWRLHEANQPVWVKDEVVPAQMKIVEWLSDIWELCIRSRSRGVYYNNHPHGMHLNLEALTPAQLEAAAMEAGVPLSTLLPPDFRPRNSEREKQRLAWKHSEGGEKAHHPTSKGEESGKEQELPLTHARLGRMVAMLGNFAHAVYHSGTLTGDIPAELSPRRRLVAHGSSLASNEHFEPFRAEMEREETKAFYARLTVAWTLFIVFWIVGTTIFHVTEGWPFGSAMYFCFMSFLTIGYGDFAPVTPAGRSIFVVWALLGIATMTILISIISEAYAYRYKSVLQSGPFTKAVKRYRAETAAQASAAHERQKSRVIPDQRPFLLGEKKNSNSDSNSNINSHEGSRSSSSPANRAGHLHSLGPEVISKKREEAQASLEALPHRILQHARSFHEHVQYFSGNGSQESIPEGVKKLMDDIAGAESLSERIRAEILQDDDARHTLFTLGIEEMLRKIIRISEEALGALEERDQLTALYNERNAQASSSPIAKTRD